MTTTPQKTNQPAKQGQLKRDPKTETDVLVEQRTEKKRHAGVGEQRRKQ